MRTCEAKIPAIELAIYILHNLYIGSETIARPTVLLQNVGADFVS